MPTIPTSAPTSLDPQTAARLATLETRVDVLLQTVQVLVDALGALAEAEEALPTDEAGEYDARVSRAAHTAHELLLTLRDQG